MSPALACLPLEVSYAPVPHLWRWGAYAALLIVLDLGDLGTHWSAIWGWQGPTNAPRNRATHMPCETLWQNLR